MEMKKPKPKKLSVPQGKPRLSLKREKEIVGVFNGHSVTVPDLNSMIYLYEAGNFGKGSLSKGEPNNHRKKDDIPKMILQHQFENQMKWSSRTDSFHPQTSTTCVNNEFKLSLESVSNFLESSFKGDEQDSWKSWKGNQKQDENIEFKSDCFISDFLSEDVTDEVEYRDQHFINIVNGILEMKQIRKPNVINTNSEEMIILDTSFDPCRNDSSVANINARFEQIPCMQRENLKLNLEESFYLKTEFGCLNIVDLNSSELSISDLWEKFNSVNKNFMERYVTYHYYRRKGWVVRSGLKYGGDYLLYKDGPAYYHASYLVKVLDRRKKLTWREFLSMNRLVETYNKDLLLTNVLQRGTSEEKSFPDVLKNYTVEEILVRRWFPSRERFSKTDEVLT